MKPEEQRIAIAQACGWSYKDTPIHAFDADRPLKAWHGPDGRAKNYVPDYLHDLNAMHEAENSPALDHLRNTYVEEIGDLLVGVRRPIQWITVYAPASVRAEAFLRTLGKWKDSNGSAS